MRIVPILCAATFLVACVSDMPDAPDADALLVESSVAVPPDDVEVMLDSVAESGAALEAETAQAVCAVACSAAITLGCGAVLVACHGAVAFSVGALLIPCGIALKAACGGVIVGVPGCAALCSTIG